MRVDRVCRWFEDEWNVGRRVRLEDCLSGFEESLRDALLVELIALEVELRMNAGESPVADEYSSRFPAAQWAVTLASVMEEAESRWLGDVPALAEAKIGLTWSEAK